MAATGGVGAVVPRRTALSNGLEQAFNQTFFDVSEDGAKRPSVSLKELLLYYGFMYIVVGVPAAALFVKRGWGSSFQDGEAFLFAGGVLLALLYDHSSRAIRTSKNIPDALEEIFRLQVAGALVWNVAMLGLSTYYVVTSSDAGAATADWVRVLWFFVAILLGSFLPMVALMPDVVPLVKEARHPTIPPGQEATSTPGSV